MARKDRGDDDKQQNVSFFQIWLEEAWEGWIKSIGLLLLVAIAVMLYKFDLIGESIAGAGLILLIIGSAVASSALPAWGLLRTPGTKALFATMILLWLGSTLYPALRTAIPPHALAEAKLTTAQPSAKLHADGSGALEVTVSGRLKPGAQDAEASYALTATGAGGSDEVKGALKRQLVRVRTGRRGGTSESLQEKTEQNHRLAHVASGELTISSADPIDEQLEDGLLVTVRAGGPPPILFIVLGALALLCAIGFDARLTDPKKKLKTYLAAAVGVSYVFALYYPEEATPHSVVRPAVAALVLALAVGGGGGWLLGVIGRAAFGPPPPKNAPARSRR